MSILFFLSISFVFCINDIDDYIFKKEFQANSYDDNSIQTLPAVVGLTNNNFVVTWHTEVGSGNPTDIRAQIFNINGDKVGSEINVNTETDDVQENPRICALSEGKFLIIWNTYLTDDQSTGSSWGIRSRKYNADGTSDDITEKPVNPPMYSIGTQNQGDVACLENDKYVAVFMDSISSHVVAQVFNSDGSFDGDPVQVSTDISDGFGEPKVSGLPGGGYFVVWDGNDQIGSGCFGNIFFPNNTKVYDEEFLINAYTSSQQNRPNIATMSNGISIIAMEEYYTIPFDDRGIFMNAYNIDGSHFYDRYEKQAHTSISNTQHFPDVSILNNNEFIICWASNDEESINYDIRCRLFQLTDSIFDGIDETDWIVNKYQDEMQMWPVVSFLTSGGFVVCWSGKGETDDFGIFCSLYHGPKSPFDWFLWGGIGGGGLLVAILVFITFQHFNSVKKKKKGKNFSSAFYNQDDNEDDDELGSTVNSLNKNTVNTYFPNVQQGGKLSNSNIKFKRPDSYEAGMVSRFSSSQPRPSPPINSVRQSFQ